MYKIILNKGGREVGDLGEYNELSEAKRIQRSFNTKPSRRGATAQIQKVQVQKNPSRSLGSLFTTEESDSDDESEYMSEEEWSQDHEFDIVEEPHESEYHESEYHESEEETSEQVEQQPRNVYRNPLDLWPIHRPTPQNKQTTQPERRRNIAPVKRTKRKFKAPYDLSVQAIMIDDDGYVLIRKPANLYRGIRWEFYGGKVKGGEDIEEALRREMIEETGYTVVLKDKIEEISIDGGFQKYFLVAPDKYAQDPHMETENAYWVSQDEAWQLLGKNNEPYKRKLRQVLDKAFTIWRRHNV